MSSFVRKAAAQPDPVLCRAANDRFVRLPVTAILLPERPLSLSARPWRVSASG